MSTQTPTTNSIHGQLIAQEVLLRTLISNLPRDVLENIEKALVETADNKHHDLVDAQAPQETIDGYFSGMSGHVRHVRHLLGKD